VFFLLKYEEILRGHRWPMPGENVLDGLDHKVASQGDFVQASERLAEVEQRLDKTGIKGELLASECKYKEKIIYLKPAAKDALFYIVGSNPKRMGFSEWLRQRKHRRREYKSVVMVQT